MRPLQRAQRKCEQLAATVRQLEIVVADLDDTLTDQLVEQLKRPVLQIDRRLNVLDEEQAVRGLGNQAVTGSAPNGRTEPFAGEPVGRGRTTRSRQ